MADQWQQWTNEQRGRRAVVRAAVQAAQTSPPFSTPAALPLMGPTTLFGNRYCDCKPERTCADNMQRDTSHATDSTTPRGYTARHAT